MQRPREAEIHFELYRHLANTLEENPTVRGVTFSRVAPEHPINGGYADIVVFDNRQRPYLVIEAKRQRADGSYDRNLDPYSPRVIAQAFRYAGTLGARYFGTYNGRVLVLFRTFEEGRPLLERRSRAYEVTDLPVFAREILSEVVALDAGDTTWDPHHEAFIRRLRIFHERLKSDITDSLQEKLADPVFATGFEAWLEAQGWDSEEEAENRQRFAAQAAYLLMNKLLFYEILKSEPAYEELQPFPDVEPELLYVALADLFAQVIETIDFEAVYEHDPIFDGVAFGPGTAEEVTEFAEELESYDLTAFDHDVIGEIYERIIPPLKRHDLGQYYTPPGIVSLITSLAIRTPDDRVLDPGCGSGGFLVGAYARLKELTRGHGSEKAHRELLEQIYGIDINRFPAHLSAINLALRNLAERTPKVRLLVEDFFDVSPSQLFMFTEAAAVGRRAGYAAPEEIPAVVEAVVGNPPYIRHERIADKNKCRAHLTPVGAELNQQSDIYAYFFTHASEFLASGGRLGFITSDAWLNVRYGEKLQDFFLDTFKILAVVVFNRQVFEEPLIATCVSILEKCDSQAERDEHLVRLLLVKRPQPLEDILELVEQPGDADTIRDDRNYRSVTLRQADLRGVRKWGRFLFAPSLYWEILASGHCRPLRDLADVRYVGKSGANDFFYFRDAAAVEEAGIEPRFVNRLLKHIAETEYIELRDEDLEWYVLDMHGFVQEVLNEAEGRHADLGAIVKAALRKHGYTGVLAYIENGEARGLHERPSIAPREVWFDLGDLARPPIAITKEFWRKWHTVRNEARAAIDQTLYAVTPKEVVDPTFLLGVLNSRLAVVLRELHGRTAAGEGMNRNRLAQYEAASLPLPDPRHFDDQALNRVRAAVAQMMEREREVPDEARDGLQVQLDRAVLALFGFEDRVEELGAAAEALLKYREEGGADRTEVLVEVAQPPHGLEMQEIRLAGARIVDGRDRIVQHSFF